MGTLLENRDNQQQRLAQARRTVNELQEQIRVITAKLASAERNGYNTAPYHRDALDVMATRLHAAQSEEATAKQAVGLADDMLNEARRLRRIHREFDAVAMLGAPPDLQQRVQWGEWSSLGGIHWVLQLLETDAEGQRVTETWKGRDGVKHTDFKARFGYEATVYGPRKDWRGSDWGEDATVNWGTLGSISVANARDMIRLHTYAVELAAWIEAHRDAWFAEDMAD